MLTYKIGTVYKDIRKQELSHIAGGGVNWYYFQLKSFDLKVPLLGIHSTDTLKHVVTFIFNLFLSGGIHSGRL